MKTRNATNTMLLWDPKTGNVVLQDWPETMVNMSTMSYRSGLACYPGVREASFEKRKAIIFIEAMHLIVRDGIDPNKLHKVLLGLEEYRDGCSSDMPGMNREKEEYLDTCEAAAMLMRKENSLRAYYQKKGHAYGIYPMKVGSRLMWSKNQVSRVARGLPPTKSSY